MIVISSLPAITARPKKPTPISLSDLTQEVDKAHEAINAVEEHFQKWRHADEHKDEKQSLKLYLAEYEPKVKEARERLNQLEAEPPAFIKFLTKVGLLERNVSGLAAEVQLNLASEAAENIAAVSCCFVYQAQIRTEHLRRESRSTLFAFRPIS